MIPKSQIYNLHVKLPYREYNQDGITIYSEGNKGFRHILNTDNVKYDERNDGHKTHVIFKHNKTITYFNDYSVTRIPQRNKLTKYIVNVKFYHKTQRLIKTYHIKDHQTGLYMSFKTVKNDTQN